MDVSTSKNALCFKSKHQPLTLLIKITWNLKTGFVESFCINVVKKCGLFFRMSYVIQYLRLMNATLKYLFIN